MICQIVHDEKPSGQIVDCSEIGGYEFQDLRDGSVREVVICNADGCWHPAIVHYVPEPPFMVLLIVGILSILFIRWVDR